MGSVQRAVDRTWGEIADRNLDCPAYSMQFSPSCSAPPCQAIGDARGWNRSYANSVGGRKREEKICVSLNSFVLSFSAARGREGVHGGFIKSSRISPGGRVGIGSGDGFNIEGPGRTGPSTHTPGPVSLTYRSRRNPLYSQLLGLTGSSHTNEASDAIRCTRAALISERDLRASASTQNLMGQRSPSSPAISTKVRESVSLRIIRYGRGISIARRDRQLGGGLGD